MQAEMSGMMFSRMQAVPSEMILSDGVLGFDTTTFIPVCPPVQVDLAETVQFPTTKLESKIIPVSGSKVVNLRPHAIPVVELGKRLLQCSRDGNTEAVRELMGKGAPFSTDWLGTSPLHFAAQGNHIATCEVLLRAGISKDARTKVERTPLHMAAYEGHSEIVELLLKHGADIDCKDMLRMTPLHWAVQNEHDDCIRLLIHYGASVDVVSKFDKTPLSMAVEQDRMDLAQAIQIAKKMLSERVQNLELQRATLAATQSLAEELNVSQSPSKEETKENTTTKNHNVNNSTETIEVENENNLNALKMLEAHGITMIPNDESSIVASAMESGQTVVLTEAGKLALHLTKPNVTTHKMQSPLKVKGRKVITLRSDQFLALTGGKYQNFFKKLNNSSSNSEVSIKPLKRIVMTKNKITVSPKTGNIAQVKINTMAKIESVTKHLNEARRIAEDYKQKYKQKEKEIEEYEKQLKILRTF